MAKVPMTFHDPARAPRPARRAAAVLMGLTFLATGPACTLPVPDAPPKPMTRAVLVCADSDQDLFTVLKPRFTKFDVSRMAENPECLRGKSAASEVGHTCFDDEASCSTPRFVDGKPIDTPTSVYDLVLLFPQLLHGSLAAKTVTTTHVVSSEGANGTASTGGRGGRGGGGPRGRTVTDNQIVVSPETDYTGEVLVFEPRPGLLHPGKRFKNVAPDPLQDLLMELLRRS